MLSWAQNGAREADLQGSLVMVNNGDHGVPRGKTSGQGITLYIYTYISKVYIYIYIHFNKYTLYIYTLYIIYKNIYICII